MNTMQCYGLKSSPFRITYKAHCSSVWQYVVALMIFQHCRMHLKTCTECEGYLLQLAVQVSRKSTQICFQMYLLSSSVHVFYQQCWKKYLRETRKWPKELMENHGYAAHDVNDIFYRTEQKFL